MAFFRLVGGLQPPGAVTGRDDVLREPDWDPLDQSGPEASTLPTKSLFCRIDVSAQLVRMVLKIVRIEGSIVGRILISRRLLVTAIS